MFLVLAINTKNSYMFIYYPVDVMGLYHKLESDVEVFVVTNWSLIKRCE